MFLSMQRVRGKIVVSWDVQNTQHIARIRQQETIPLQRKTSHLLRNGNQQQLEVTRSRFDRTGSSQDRRIESNSDFSHTSESNRDGLVTTD